MKLNINSEKIVELDQISHILIEGIIEMDNNSPFCVEAIVDGDNLKRVECSEQRVEVNEYSYSLKFVDELVKFYLYAKVNKDFESLVLYSNKEELLHIFEDDKKQYLTSDSIIYSFDKIEISKNDKGVSIYGWAISLNEKPVTINLLSNDTSLDFTYHKTIRRDLIERGFLTKNQVLCGFDIYFQADKLSDVYVQFSSGNNISKHPVTFQEKQNGTILLSLVKNINGETILKAIRYLKNNGFKGLINRLSQGYQNPADYHNWFMCHRIDEETIKEQIKVKWSYSPKISILVPTFNTPDDLLVEMIDSVLNQTYQNWELCIADASQNHEKILKIINKIVDGDKRVVIKNINNDGIAENTNQALSMATGEYIALLDHDDFLETDALFEIVKLLNDYPYDCLYTDEDKYNMDTAKFDDPNFKPDFSIDSLRSHNYITHFFVAKKTMVEEIGGERKKYDGAQDYDLILRCVERANKVGHISKILYHWRIHPGSTAGDPESKMYCYEAGRKAISDHLQRLGIQGTVTMLGKPYWGLYHVKYDVIGEPLVSIIIPNYENKKCLEKCIHSLLNVNTYNNIEIVIIENNSSSQEIFDYYKYLEHEYSFIKIVNLGKRIFNYSELNNIGVKNSSGEYILFLNNDTEILAPDSISEMLGMCQRDDVGIVGAKLLYDDDTVQHAGVVIGFGGVAGHVFSRINKNDPGYMMRALISYDYSAVTAACMMTKRSVYQSVNGMDERFKVAFNDIDYCLKIRNLNKLVVYNAFSIWRHYESVSRGYEKDFKKISRYNKEVQLFQEKWIELLKEGDPYYNKNFTNDANQFEVD